MPAGTMLHSRSAGRAKSCQNCRLLKVKCNRALQCDHCVRTRRACCYAPANDTSTNLLSTDESVSEASDDPHLDRQRCVCGCKKRSDSQRPATLSNSIPGQARTVCVESCLRQATFIDALMSIWFRELDFMYDIVLHTEASELWHRGELDVVSHPKYTAFLAALLALTAQLCAPDLDAALESCLGEHTSSRDLIASAIDVAEMKIDAATGDPEEHAHELPEHLQAHFLICIYLKNTGQSEKYRAKLAQAISYMTSASFHMLDAFEDNEVDTPSRRAFMALAAPVPVLVLTSAQRHLVRRLFWGMFVCDRLFLTIGGVSSSYCLNELHADIWLLSRSGRHRHIHALHTDSADVREFTRPEACLQQGDNQQPCSSISGAKPVSTYIEALVLIAAASERCMSRLSYLRQLDRRAFGIPDTKTISAMRYEQVRQAEVELEELKYTFLDGDHDHSRFGQLVGGDDSMLSQQRQVLRLLLLRLQRDWSVGVAAPLSAELPQTAAWLAERRHFSAYALLEECLKTTLVFPPRSMSWVFFLHYLAEPTNCLIDTSYDTAEYPVSQRKSSVSLVVRSRNLLCLIAKQSGSLLSQECARSVSVKLQKLTIDTHDKVLAESARLDLRPSDRVLKSLRVLHAVQNSIETLSESIDPQETSEAFYYLQAMRRAWNSHDSLANSERLLHIVTRADVLIHPSDGPPAIPAPGRQGILNMSSNHDIDALRFEHLEATVSGSQSEESLQHLEALSWDAWSDVDASTGLRVLLSLPFPLPSGM